METCDRSFTIHTNGGISSFALKIIAVASMLSDHIGRILLADTPACFPMYAFGRLSFVLFAFLIAQGAFYSRRPYRYLLRLAVFACISEVPYDLAFFGRFPVIHHQNIFLTLSIGLLLILIFQRLSPSLLGDRAALFLPQGQAGAYAYKIISSAAAFILMAVSLIVLCGLAQMIHADYGAAGVLLIFLFYLLRNRRWYVWAIAFFLVSVVTWAPIELFGLAAFLPVMFWKGKQGPSGSVLKYLFYLIYPVHLLIIGMIVCQA